jgi:hypothetical protein
MIVEKEFSLATPDSVLAASTSIVQDASRAKA